MFDIPADEPREFIKQERECETFRQVLCKHILCMDKGGKKGDFRLEYLNGYVPSFLQRKSRCCGCGFFGCACCGSRCCFCAP